MTPLTPGTRLRWHRTWVALGLLVMAWTLFMALRPDPGFTLQVPDGDKWLHAFVFTCLMGWWGNVYARGRPRAVAAAACLVFGVFIEFAQWLSPPRDADPLDVLADALGIGLGLVLLRTPLARVLASGEALLLRRC